MAAMSFTRFLTLATLASVSFAQTITVDGKEVLADESNIAPAVETISVSASSSKADLFPAEKLQLTEATLQNLTDLGLSNISLFGFEDAQAGLEKRSLFGNCKTAPGDFLYPTSLVWKVLKLLSGGALRKTVPLASVCYKDWDNYNKAECEWLTANWLNDSSIHVEDPTSVNSVLFEGSTCLPPDLFNVDGCEVGGYPSYYIDATSVAHVQLAVNLARNLNLRLVVKNTGHDFSAKSTGYGALSIWTHNLDSAEFYKEYESGSYKGSAFKLGSGILAHKVYEAAYANGVTAVGGESGTVGPVGGFIQGGGHSPLSGKVGMAADQVLSFEVVTADGRFVTASEKENSDLFWALRGGGGSTYGVVTSAVVKAHPKIDAVSFTKFSITSGTGNVTDEMFWKAIKAFWVRFPEFARDNGNYEYFSIYNIGTGYTFAMAPWFAPGFTADELRELTAPLWAEWEEIGITVDAEFEEHDDFYTAWKAAFTTEAWGSPYLRQGSRLFPEANWANDTIIEKSFESVKSTVEDGNYVIAFNIFAGVDGYPDNAVNPAWRDALMHCISVVLWDDYADEATKKAASDKLTFDYVQRWRDVTPGGGAYLGEADYIEPDFKTAFWGSKYERLLEIKEKWDPNELFYTTNAVGSDKWELQKKIFGNLPSQNSKLCRA